ncbi:MAG: hypothetical protein SWX82_07560 [Cyanobacteriota bacterium]|nr:hypothetical protein [Cyanobacteriota bacterium]
MGTHIESGYIVYVYNYTLSLQSPLLPHSPTFNYIISIQPDLISSPNQLSTLYRQRVLYPTEKIEEGRRQLCCLRSIP